MMKFDFLKTKFTYGEITDEHRLEKKIDYISELKPKQQVALLYNDVQNHIAIKSNGFDEWYLKRAKVIEQYAELNWNGLANHLNQHQSTFGSMCINIKQGLDLLVSEMNKMKRFQMTVFCSVLGKIDYLFHILLPSFLKDIQDPSVIHLLHYFGQI